MESAHAAVLAAMIFPMTLGTLTMRGGLTFADAHPASSHVGHYRIAGGETTVTTPFRHPTGMALDRGRNLYVADWGTARIYSLSSAGDTLARWGGRHEGDGSLQNPEGLAVDGRGHVFVADAGSPQEGRGSRIVEYTDRGIFVRQWGTWKRDLVQFSHPHGVAVSPTGALYVSDWGNNRIVVIRSDGARATQWAMRGADAGQFQHPLGIAVDQAGNVYIADDGAARIQKLTSSGHFLAEWSTGTRFEPSPTDYRPETELATFGYPLGLTVDRDGHVYMTDWANNSVRVFTDVGKPLLQWPLPERASAFRAPAGLVVEPTGTLVVGEFWTGRLYRRDLSRLLRHAAKRP